MDAREGNEPTKPGESTNEEGLAHRVADRTREAASRAKDGIAAGASSVAGFTRSVASETRERAGRAVDFVREAETDQKLKGTVTDTTSRGLDRAGDKVTEAAPAIGRNAERAAEKLGQGLHLIARPLGVVLGVIAGTLGGWWKKAAADNGFELKGPDEEACRAHFTTITVVPDMTYDRARTGYSVGYVASRNPDYRGRPFEEVEPELRQGFGDEHADAYEALREFTRYGYIRGIGAEL